ncbi:hypothetical protein QNA23_10715 [Rhodococcus erythropolis]|uniref:hypothetical protein n=1 Tax=Rhodococcus erythropolis TaxID=1833 RepID=UPI0024B9AF85|nr:hypothetical protein [Rhodococcus erythropolis]MDJ0403954.1 hypothetical protein [Rhodococcus erythropolis]
MIVARFHGTTRSDFTTEQEAHEWIQTHAEAGGYSLVIDSYFGSDVFQYSVWNRDENGKLLWRVTDAAVLNSVPAPVADNLDNPLIIDAEVVDA